MLKTLDVLIGSVTVLLLFSMAVTVITQALSGMLQRRGRHLRAGLADLLQHLGIDTRVDAVQIADRILRSPLISDGRKKLGTVVHREEFIKILLEFAADENGATLSPELKAKLIALMQQNGIADPGVALANIRALEMQLEASDPQLADHVRQSLAIVHEAASSFVAKINSSYDQIIDRVSQRFTNYTHRMTLVVAAVVVLAVQLDIIAVIDRLSIDDQFRSAVVNASSSQYAGSSGSTPANQRLYYDLLNKAGLITLPTDKTWPAQLKDARKIPGMLLSALLLALGAPFWYGILRDLLKLRSDIAQKDDAQREQRQATQPVAAPTNSGLQAPASSALLAGERGDLSATG